jgi:hypothetical protein
MAKTCKNIQNSCCVLGSIEKMQGAMNGKLAGYLASMQGMVVYIRENLRLAGDIQSFKGPTGK